MSKCNLALLGETRSAGLVGYSQMTTFKIENRLVLPVTWKVELPDNKNCFIFKVENYYKSKKMQFITRRQNVCNWNWKLLHISFCVHFNPFVSIAPFLYSLKTSCFRGVVKGCIGNEWIELHESQNTFRKVDHIV